MKLNKPFKLRIIALSGVAGIALLASSPAVAEQSTAISAAGGSIPDNGEIVVTAQRRAERLQDVPIAITTIDSKAIERANVRQIGDISKLTAGLRFDSAGSTVQPTIRGIGSSLTGSGVGSNVGIYIDGFYAPNPETADFHLLNVENVQVLKGPQGTLFGRNSTGGAILVTTGKPSTDTSATAEISYGRFNTQRYQAYATTGLSDKIAVDIAGLYTKGNGFLRDIVTGSKKDGAQEDWSVRLGLKAELSDKAWLLLRYAHSNNKGSGNYTSNAYVQDGRALTIATTIPGAIIATDPREVSESGPTIARSHTDIGQLTAEYDFDFAKLTSYTQYRSESAFSAEDLDSSSISIFDVNFEVVHKTFTQEFILTSAPGPRLQWTTGLFYISDKNPYNNVLGSSSGGPYSLLTYSNTNTYSGAAYLDATYELIDNLFVTAGARYSHDEVKNAFYYSVYPPSGVVYAPSIKSDRITPRFVLRYKPDDQSSIYGSFSRGYKAAIINVGGQSTVPVSPETIAAYEIGYKYASRAFSLDISAYHYDYKNLQVSTYDGTQSRVTNAANARINGIEGQVRYQITPQFQLTAGGAYTDAKYKDFKASPFFQQCLDPACGAAFGTFPTATIDASGFRLQRSAKFTGNIGADYRTDLARGKLGLSANVFHTSKFYFDSSQQFPQKAYELVSLRAEWTDPSDRFTLAVFGDNITNSKYRTQLLEGLLAIQNVWAPPVTYGASVRVRY